jgi:hypothetical protein
MSYNERKHVRQIIERGIAWHRGTLPRSEILPSYIAHIDGPSAHSEVYFHTYACLHPSFNIYMVVNTNEWPGYGIDQEELHQFVANASVSQAKVDHQQQKIMESFGPTDSLDQQWDIGKHMAETLLLPVGMYVFGDTPTPQSERVIILMTALVAPLEKVVAKFKMATHKSR